MIRRTMCKGVIQRVALVFIGRKPSTILKQMAFPCWAKSPQVGRKPLTGWPCLRRVGSIRGERLIRRLHFRLTWRKVTIVSCRDASFLAWRKNHGFLYFLLETILSGLGCSSSEQQHSLEPKRRLSFPLFWLSLSPFQFFVLCSLLGNRTELLWQRTVALSGRRRFLQSCLQLSCLAAAIRAQLSGDRLLCFRSQQRRHLLAPVHAAVGYAGPPLAARAGRRRGMVRRRQDQADGHAALLLFTPADSRQKLFLSSASPLAEGRPNH